MARILCTQRLWKGLRQPGRPPATVDEPTVADARLGSWAAKVARFDRRDLVVAVNARSYLTVVFPLRPTAAFRSHFAGAVRAALEDLGVMEQWIFVECSAVEVAPLARHADRSLLGTLNDLEFHCRVELGYDDDLRRVQRRLNEIPHANLKPHYVPISATRALFAPSEEMPATGLRH